MNPHEHKEFGADDIINILSHTIIGDNDNKLITFFCYLSAYTDQEQLNISFNSPSSTGKTYIATEIAKLFPSEDIWPLGSSSPTAFFHENGVYDKETNTHLVDISRKVILFLDQPNSYLLEKLRPILSHDMKEIISKITDKSANGANRTKTVTLRGYAAIIFCSASLKSDEQESTRFIFLSPATDEEKLLGSIQAKVIRESDRAAHKAKIEALEDRKLLIERIKAIKNAKIGDIIVDESEIVFDSFLKSINEVSPRHNRDVGRLLSFIKMFALLNFWHREIKEGAVVANNNDINSGIKLWNAICESQYLGLSPYLVTFFKNVICHLFLSKNKDRLNTERTNVDECIGLTTIEVINGHLTHLGSILPRWKLYSDYIAPLEAASLICRKKGVDRRSDVFFPTKFLP